MRKRNWIGLAVMILALGLAGCAPGVNPLVDPPADEGPAGFWLGLWQGFIALFAFIISLFRDDVGIYEVHNNGSLYDFGYILGLLCFFSGGGKSCCRKRKH
ncbi:MAG: hypothetical protein GY953_24125 [bacterium]|nr:hypothetical protein [bacterium]